MEQEVAEDGAKNQCYNQLMITFKSNHLKIYDKLTPKYDLIDYLTMGKANFLQV